MNTWSEYSDGCESYYDHKKYLTMRFVHFIFLVSFSMVLDDAVEIDSKKNARQEVGRILLKGDSITCLQEANPVRPQETE